MEIIIILNRIFLCGFMFCLYKGAVGLFRKKSIEYIETYFLIGILFFALFVWD